MSESKPGIVYPARVISVFGQDSEVVNNDSELVEAVRKAIDRSPTAEAVVSQHAEIE